MSASKILSGIKIEGKLTGTSDIKVEGEVFGEIFLDSSIFIAEGGNVDATIKAVNVFIAGNFQGDIKADFVQITPTGKGKGTIKAPAISIEKGAKFTGSLEMGEEVAEDRGSSAKEINESADRENEEYVQPGDTAPVSPPPIPASELDKKETPREKEPFKNLREPFVPGEIKEKSDEDENRE